MSFLPRLAAALLVATPAFAAASTADAYIDLRAGAGLVGGEGYGGHITLMGGTVAYETPGARRPGQTDAGFALGLRISERTLPIDGVDTGGDDEAHLTGGSLLGGFAFWIGRSITVETLFQYGGGYLSQSDIVTFGSDEGDYTLMGGEANVAYTFDSGFQLGVSGGYDRIDLTLTIDGQSDEGTGNGLAIGAFGGYRF